MREIRRLEAGRTRLAVISAIRLDGRRDLSFDKTNPLVLDYLLSRLAPLDQNILPQWFVVLAPR